MKKKDSLPVGKRIKLFGVSSALRNGMGPGTKTVAQKSPFIKARK